MTEVVAALLPSSSRAEERERSSRTRETWPSRSVFFGGGSQRKKREEVEEKNDGRKRKWELKSLLSVFLLLVDFVPFFLSGASSRIMLDATRKRQRREEASRQKRKRKRNN